MKPLSIALLLAVIGPAVADPDLNARLRPAAVDGLTREQHLRRGVVGRAVGYSLYTLAGVTVVTTAVAWARAEIAYRSTPNLPYGAQVAADKAFVDQQVTILTTAGITAGAELLVGLLANQWGSSHLDDAFREGEATRSSPGASPSLNAPSTKGEPVDPANPAAAPVVERPPGYCGDAASCDAGLVCAFNRCGQPCDDKPCPDGERCRPWKADKKVCQKP